MEKPGTFKFMGDTLPYLRSPSNNAGDNELSVEVPVALALHNHARFLGGNILEVGAILPYYMPSWVAVRSGLGEDIRSRRSGVMEFKKIEYPHRCIDSRDHGLGIDNIDILDYQPTEEYTFILSLDTMGTIFDRRDYTDDRKIEEVINLWRNMATWLSPSGVMLITLAAFGTKNYWVDLLLDILKLSVRGSREAVPEIMDSSWQPDRIVKMNRVGFGVAGNNWTEVDVLKSPDLPYESSAPSARTVYFLLWTNKGFRHE